MRSKDAMKTYWKFFRIAICILFVIFLGAFSGMIAGIISQAENFDIENLRMNFTSFVYYTDPETGEEVELDRLYDNENRIWAPYTSIPKYMKDAVVSIEDERFYKHKGFDVKRLLGAAFTTLRKGEYGYGASTITQQLVKNLTGDDEVTITRKIQEIYRATKIERELSKDQILELYLNTIYLSQQCNGVQAAANVYFGKDVSELTLAECASIAGITQFPSKYDPIVNPEQNKEKQELVLGKMLELGKITKEEHDNAVKEKLVFAKSLDADDVILSNSYFVDAVIEEVLHDLCEEKGYARQVALKMLYSGGLKIYSTVDINIQKTMEDVYTNAANFPKTSGNEQPESAMVTIDPKTGNIVGLVGGRGEKTASRTLNRATQTLRQPGSTIKPIAVYAPALEYGHITPNSTILDNPITIDGWSPKNANGTFSGMVTIRYAVARSLNIPAVKVLDKISLDTSFDFMQNNLGITSLVENELRDGKVYTDKGYAALSLGGLTDGVSVMEMCAAYTPFASKGIYIKPSTYTKVLDHNGEVILDHSKDDDIKVAMSEHTAFLMTQMLQGVVQNGTGTAARLNNMPAAGKTGTTTSDHDRWFVGYTPYYVSAVWFGFDKPKSMASIGANPAIPIWKKVMNEIHKDMPYKTFEMPSGVIQVPICTVSNKVATPLCYKDVRGSKVIYEYHKGTDAPRETCDTHLSFMICGDSKKLASVGCPYKEEVSALGIASEEKDGYILDNTCDMHLDIEVSENTQTPPPVDTIITPNDNPIRPERTREPTAVSDETAA